MPRHRFVEQLARSWPADQWRDVTTLVAVSGGADSIALLRGMAELRTDGTGHLIAAHYNHGLRGEESDADERFTVALCRQLQVPFEVGRSAESLASEGDGVEAAAREARYGFLINTADRVGARYIATAHTADDQVETILLRFLRGTGIGGLAGIPRARATSGSATIVRPLLSVRRKEVLDYLAACNQPFREDASNRDPAFARNKLRHELLPMIARDFNPRVDEAMLRLSELARESQQLVDSWLEQLWTQRVAIESSARVRIDCRDLACVSDYLLRELLIAIWKRQQWPQQAMSFETWRDLARVARDTNARRDLPGGIRAEKRGEWLTLTRPE